MSSDLIRELIRTDVRASIQRKKQQAAGAKTDAASVAAAREQDDIEDMTSFTRNCSRALRVRSAAEAVELLLSRYCMIINMFTLRRQPELLFFPVQQTDV